MRTCGICSHLQKAIRKKQMLSLEHNKLPSVGLRRRFEVERGRTFSLGFTVARRHRGACDWQSRLSASPPVLIWLLGWSSRVPKSSPRPVTAASLLAFSFFTLFNCLALKIKLVLLEQEWLKCISSTPCIDLQSCWFCVCLCITCVFKLLICFLCSTLSLSSLDRIN